MTINLASIILSTDGQSYAAQIQYRLSMSMYGV